MATLHVKQFSSFTTLQGKLVPATQEPGGPETELTIAATATSSAAFADLTTMVRLAAEADCHVKFGESPSANTTHQPMYAGQVEYKGVKPGHRVSVTST